MMKNLFSKKFDYDSTNNSVLEMIQPNKIYVSVGQSRNGLYLQDSITFIVQTGQDLLSILIRLVLLQEPVPGPLALQGVVRNVARVAGKESG